MYFGRPSLLLALGALNGAVLAALLLNVARQRAASRWLAALLVLLAWRLMPYVLGFAGVYDAYPELTFFPFALTLAFGPLLWAYAAHLTTGSAPRSMPWHLAPAALQLVASVVAFAQPLEVKWAWYTGPYNHAVGAVETLLSAVSMLAYAVAARHRVTVWRSWLLDHESAHDRLQVGPLVGVLNGCVALGALALGYAVAPLVGVETTYLARLPLMGAWAALAYALGLVGWRLGGVVVPVPAVSGAAVRDDAEGPPSAPVREPLVGADAASAPTAPDVPLTPRRPAGLRGDEAPPAAPDRPGANGRASRDYAALGAAWAERIAREGWVRDPDLTLTGLAERLDTSERTLSRVLADGLGVRFHPFVNGLRADLVAAALADPADRRDVLEIAFDAGFASKASFNRAFRARTGRTPTQVRRQRPDFRQAA